MIAGLKPYPVMKDSGVEWLGKIPDHWTEKRAKYFYREADERSTTGEEELLSVSHKTGVTPRKQSVTMFMAESTVGYKLCRPNDVAANTMWVFMGALGVSKQVGLVSPSYGVYRPMRPGDLLPEYVDRLLRVDGYKAEYMCRLTGINSSRLRLYPDDFLRIPIVCPPISEQAAIVRYLDHVDRRVRRLVRAKRRLIALLTEQKQAIIHRAVTRGLDPDMLLKDSGVQWLGEVPAHWEVQRLKTLCRMRSGDAITAMSIESSGEYPVYGGNGIRGYASDFTHDGNFVLIGRQGALCGNVHIARGKLWASEHAVVATLRRDDSLEWFALILEVMNLNQYSIAAAQPGLAVERVLNLWVPVPSRAEQKEIALHVAESTTEIEGTIDRTNREIDLLTEYRTRLTADVVTGKLDVRQGAAALPEIDPLAADDGPDTLDAESETDPEELDVIAEEDEE